MMRMDTTLEELTRWQATPHAIARHDVVVRVEGPGAVACLQGLFTNDVERAGVNSLTWGAVLTPKGMIITDLWIWRREDHLLLLVPAEGAAPLLELLRKSFPPRLAKVTDLRDRCGVVATHRHAVACIDLAPQLHAAHPVHSADQQRVHGAHVAMVDTAGDARVRWHGGVDDLLHAVDHGAHGVNHAAHAVDHRADGAVRRRRRGICRTLFGLLAAR